MCFKSENYNYDRLHISVCNKLSLKKGNIHQSCTICKNIYIINIFRPLIKSGAKYFYKKKKKKKNCVKIHKLCNSQCRTIRYCMIFAFMYSLSFPINFVFWSLYTFAGKNTLGYLPKDKIQKKSGNVTRRKMLK